MTAERTALYLRVSTDAQTTENQRLELERLCELRGWKIVAVYQDEGISGAKGRDQRPSFKALMKDAARRRFDRVVAWSVDRLGRSTAVATTAMDELGELGVRQFYHKEGVDTGTAHGRAMLEMAAVFARLERDMIRERVKAGLARAREQGTKNGNPIGRPKVDGKTEEAIRAALRAGGKGIQKIARELGVGVSVVQRVKAAA